MFDENSLEILRKVFLGSTSSGVSAQRFRAENYQFLDLIDSLASSRHIEITEGRYVLRLESLLELKETTPEVDRLINLCNLLFGVLKKAYLDNPGESITLEELTSLSGVPRIEIYPAIPFLWEASLFSGMTGDLEAKDAYITPAEKVLRYDSFDIVIEEIRGWRRDTPPTSANIASAFNFPGIGNDVLRLDELLHPIISENALKKFQDGHLRNAVLDSVIAVFDQIRKLTGLLEDGDELIGKSFSLSDPFLILSEIETESGKNDQKGFIQIFKGVYQGIRNPKAHSLAHDLTPVEAAQYLVLMSLLARRVEEAQIIKTRT